MNNNNMDLEKLSKAVMERIVEEVKRVSSGKTTSGSDKLQIDGEPFNPAIHRRFISAQMIRLMEVYHMDYNTAVRNSYDLMYSIKFTIEECKKIAGYEKYNPVAHEERSHCFPLEDCKTIFMDYFRKVEAYLLKNDREKYYKRHNCVTRYVKGRGGYQVAGSYNEVIKNGKIVREFVPNESYKKLLDEVGCHTPAYKLPLSKRHRSCIPVYQSLTLTVPQHLCLTSLCTMRHSVQLHCTR